MGHLQPIETLAQLRKEVPDTQIIDRISAVFRPDANNLPPARRAEHSGQLQLMFEQSGLDRFEFERLCITLGANSLTIALGHRHTTEDLPTIGAAHRFDASTLMITPNGHRHFLTLNNRASGEYTDRAAANTFYPRLEHTLNVLELGRRATGGFGKRAI